MTKQVFDEILESETFGEDNRPYFLDLCMAANYKPFYG